MTSEQDLMNLGIKGLNIPRHKIQSTIHDKDSINDAAHHVISTWVGQQNNRSEAYLNLISGLQKCRMNQLASELKQWVEGAVDIHMISEDS